ncbi:MAG: hypothetical protein Q7V31_16040 [Parvibaculum sp.]|uniref:hypothetical protein n=1 Tax=Parvibaculum sp. TaxID=2024848 RepID=UPI00271F7C86|nr:hypothetical protein [Parvibaculum sp.]MDO8840424.1 hypothetical protein [Parvibaculum sp.]
MSANVPGAAPPQPSNDVFSGGWLGVLFGGAKEILSTTQQHQLAKMTLKAQGNSLAAPPNYQTVPPAPYAYSAGLPWDTIALAAGAGLLAIYLLRR